MTRDFLGLSVSVCAGVLGTWRLDPLEQTQMGVTKTAFALSDPPKPMVCDMSVRSPHSQALRKPFSALCGIALLAGHFVKEQME